MPNGIEKFSKVVCFTVDTNPDAKTIPGSFGFDDMECLKATREALLSAKSSADMVIKLLKANAYGSILTLAMRGAEKLHEGVGGLK